MPVHIPEIKLVRTVWMFSEKIEKLSSGVYVLYTTSNLIIFMSLSGRERQKNVSKCKTHVRGVRPDLLFLLINN